MNFESKKRIIYRHPMTKKMSSNSWFALNTVHYISFDAIIYFLMRCIFEMTCLVLNGLFVDLYFPSKWPSVSQQIDMIWFDTQFDCAICFVCYIMKIIIMHDDFFNKRGLIDLTDKLLAWTFKFKAFQCQIYNLLR